ncbi:MAG: hypothetical protein V4490_01445 [Pseudomonadota bacterium]
MIELHYPLKRQAILNDLLRYLHHRLSHPIYKMLTYIVGIGTLALLPYYYLAWDLDAYWVMLHILIVVITFGRYRIARMLIRKGIMRAPWSEHWVRLTICDKELSYKIDMEGGVEHTILLNKLAKVYDFGDAWIIFAPGKGLIWIPFSVFPDRASLTTVKRSLQSHDVPVETAHGM